MSKKKKNSRGLEEKRSEEREIRMAIYNFSSSKPNYTCNLAFGLNSFHVPLLGFQVA